MRSLDLGLYSTARPIVDLKAAAKATRLHFIGGVLAAAKTTTSGEDVAAISGTESAGPLGFEPFVVVGCLA